MIPSVLAKVQELLDEGLETKEIASRLDLKDDTLRKAILSGRLHRAKKKALPT